MHARTQKMSIWFLSGFYMVQQNIYIASIHFVLFILFEVEDRSPVEVC